MSTHIGLSPLAHDHTSSVFSCSSPLSSSTTNKVEFTHPMPYTALQTLGWLASCSNWERIYNAAKVPRSSRKRVGSNFRLVVCRGQYKKSGRQVLVFKPVGQRGHLSVRKVDSPCGCCGLCERLFSTLYICEQSTNEI